MKNLLMWLMLVCAINVFASHKNNSTYIPAVEQEIYELKKEIQQKSKELEMHEKEHELFLKKQKEAKQKEFLKNEKDKRIGTLQGRLIIRLEDAIGFDKSKSDEIKANNDKYNDEEEPCLWERGHNFLTEFANKKLIAHRYIDVNKNIVIDEHNNPRIDTNNEMYYKIENISCCEAMCIRAQSLACCFCICCPYEPSESNMRTEHLLKDYRSLTHARLTYFKAKECAALNTVASSEPVASFNPIEIKVSELMNRD